MKNSHSLNQVLCIPMENRSYNPSFHPVNKSVSHANTENKTAEQGQPHIYIFQLKLEDILKVKRQKLYLNCYSSENNCFVYLCMGKFMCISARHDGALNILHLPGCEKESNEKHLLFAWWERRSSDKKTQKRSRNSVLYFTFVFTVVVCSQVPRSRSLLPESV